LVDAAAQPDGAAVLRVPAPLAPEPLPEPLLQHYRLEHDPAARRYTSLAWLGGSLPGPEEVAALQAWGARIDEMVAPVEALLVLMAASPRVPLDLSFDLPPDGLAQEDLPPMLQEPLLVEPHGLKWIGAAAPTEAEIAAMLAIQAAADAMQALQTLAGLGEEAVGATVPMQSLPLRPRRSGLPELLQDRLLITPTRVEWSGELPSAEQMDLLAALAGDATQEAAFRGAVGEIVRLVAADERQPVATPLDVSMRPNQGALPDALAGQLLLGRQPIIARRQVSAVQAAALADLFAFAPEQRAILRLPAATLASALRGRKLELRTRRGSATPSVRLPLGIAQR
jgi:hypothetical protein